MEYIKMIPVQPKTITQMGIDATNKLMYVTFSSGVSYQYQDVSQ